MTLHEHALALADRLIPTIPCAADKSPLTARGFYDATIDPQRADYERAALIGMPTGAASGFDVLDVDPRHGGATWLREHADKLPTTRTVHTRSGGVHIYFRARPGMRCSTSRIAPGIDVKAAGGFVVAWQCSGFPVEHADTVADWPGWLADLAAGTRAKESGPTASLPPPPNAAAVVSLLGRMPNPDDTSRDTYIGVMLAAKGCFDSLPDDDGADNIADAAIEWAARWSGSPGEAAEREKWESDFSRRDAPLAGWPQLLAAAHRFGVDTTQERADAAADEFAGVELPPAPAATRRLRMRDRVISPADCETLPGREYLIKGLLATGDVGALIGAPGCGKSTLAATICYALAQGRAVFGMRSKPGASVLYVAGEDFSGLRQRVLALRQRFGDAPTFRLVDCENLNDEGATADLCETVAYIEPALVVIDTLNAAWGGLDENSSVDMGRVVALARRIAAMGATVLLVHHVAKQSDGTPRGHSSLNGTLDMCLALGAVDDGGVIRSKLSKNRNGSLEIDLAFRQNVVTLGTDSDGDPITTTIAMEVRGDAAARRPKLTERESHALRILASMAPVGEPVCEKVWLARCDDERVSTSDSTRNRRTAILRIYKNLLDHGAVAAGDGAYRLLRAPATLQPDATEETLGATGCNWMQPSNPVAMRGATDATGP